MAPSSKRFAPKNHTVKTVPAAVGGINARDSIADMPPTDAISLINWIPDTYGLRCRKGWVEWGINFAAEVQSIFSWFGTTSVFPSSPAYPDVPAQLPAQTYAATKNGIYPISVYTAAPVADKVLSGADNAGWFSTAMMTNSAGSFLLACSESDGYFTYDGTTWIKVTLGGGATQISGVDPIKFCFVMIWKRRAWFIEKDTTHAWYLATDTLYGAATKFDFGPLLLHGGTLAYIAKWTIDAGDGVDDYLVVVGSNGDVLVYRGTDPAAAATFALVGTYYVGQIPVGRRAFCQYGGDLIIVSTDGVFPISGITKGGSGLLVASNRDYSSKIRPMIGADLRASFLTLGWQAIMHPSERLLLIGVPDSGALSKVQYAMSTSQEGWCKFQNIPGYSYGSVGGYLLTGTRDGKVLLLFSSGFDNVPHSSSVGDLIAGYVYPAFNYFDSPALEKQFLLVRPVILSLAQPGVIADVSVNFVVVTPIGTPTIPPPSGDLWDTGAWDTALWSGNQELYKDWSSVSGVGFSGAASIATQCLGDSTMASIDYMWMTGGPL